MIVPKGSSLSGGDLGHDLGRPIKEILELLDKKIEEICKERKIRNAVVRSRLLSTVYMILDKNDINIVGEKTYALASFGMFDATKEEYSLDQLSEIAKWDIGMEHPFFLKIPRTILDLSSDKASELLSIIAKEYVDSEVKRVDSTMNVIQMSPIFGKMDYKLDSNLCFILQAFRDPLNKIYYEIIKPTVESCNLVCRRADEIRSTTAIILDIFKSICEARIVIADLTYSNPNVFYELGMAHTIGKDTILIYQKEQQQHQIPFDLSHIRRIEYDDTAIGGKKLEKDLKETITSIIGKRFEPQSITTTISEG